LEFAPTVAGEFEMHELASPSGTLQFHCGLQNDRFTFSVARGGWQVVEPSEVSFSIDGVDLTANVKIGQIEPYELEEQYPWCGGHSVAFNRCRGWKIAMQHTPSGRVSTFEVRVYDDGVAYRHLAPAGAGLQVPDELTRLVLPAGSRAWFHNLDSHYEGVHKNLPIEEIPEGQWIGPPITFQLPEERGYVALTEAALTDYSGMALQADGLRGFRIVLGHAHHVSHPFELRYPDDVERLKTPAAIEGAIASPWRVIQVCDDLNALVNSDIVHNCASPPDAELFPEGLATEWLRPGRAVWRYLDGGERTIDEVKRFSELAGRLGFEYQVVEGFWHEWNDDEIQDVVAHSKRHGVQLWFWEHSRDLRTPATREAFFERLERLGVVGAKIDFFDHEHLEVVNLYSQLLASAARHRILVNFHGANKPTGLSRTWPNELVREGVRGLEYRSPPERARHNATLPFTRYLAGHGEYTPVIFNERQCDTTSAHQVATAVIFTAPLLTYAAHPQALLEHPARDVLGSIPSTWDETIVLEGSEIGKVALFARRSGDQWFVAALNGGDARSLRVPLAFLHQDNHSATLVQDASANPKEVAINKRTVSDETTLEIELATGGGFVGRFTPSEDPN
jgi:alpha-glucosidase